MAVESKDVEPVAEDVTLELDYDIEQFETKTIDHTKDSHFNSEIFDFIEQAMFFPTNILEAHDQQDGCILKPTAKVDTEVSDKKTQPVLKNLSKFNSLSDQELDDTKFGNEKSDSRRTTLNPFSKIFVPKSYTTKYPEFCPQTTYDTPEHSISASLLDMKHERELLAEADLPYVKQKFTKEMRLIWNAQEKEGISTHGSSMSFGCSINQTSRELSTNKFFNSIWSVSQEDRRLLAPRVVTTPCGCPPAFGFNIPPDFFGNPSNLKPICSEQGIHASFYENEKPQMEDIPLMDLHSKTPLHFLSDAESNSTGSDESRELRLIEYKKTFESCVLEIRSIAEMMKNELNENISSDEDKVLKPKDIGKKPSLRNSLENENRQSLFPKTNSLPQNTFGDDLITSFDRCTRLRQWYFGHDSPIRSLCNTPCSVWCDSNKNDKLWGWNKTNVEAKVSRLHAASKLKNEKSEYSRSLISGSRNVVSRVSLQANDISLDNFRVLKDLKRDVNSESDSDRSRHSSGDSGYASSISTDTGYASSISMDTGYSSSTVSMDTGYSSSTVSMDTAYASSTVSMDTAYASSTVSMDTKQKSSGKAPADDWLDFGSSYWTALPECLPQQFQETSIQRNPSTVKESNQWLLKTQKPRPRNQAFNESRMKSVWQN